MAEQGGEGRSGMVGRMRRDRWEGWRQEGETSAEKGRGREGGM